MEFKKIKQDVIGFIKCCYKEKEGYKLTSNSDISPFALCFAIFNYYLLKKKKFLTDNREIFLKILLKNIFKYKKEREKIIELAYDKPFLQLLTFTLSSIFILDEINNEPLEKIVKPLLQEDIGKYLNKIGTFECVPQSGNLSMFLAILYIHANKYLGLNVQSKIDQWVEIHLNRMNEFGFWGNNKKFSYLQFQNGFHQYEIFEYLSISNPKYKNAIKNILELRDKKGHFAPYPGGGGCYDYDAVSILTGKEVDFIEKGLLNKTLKTIISEKNDDGGFCENRYVRPRSLKNINMCISHFFNVKNYAKIESLKYLITLQRNKHNRVNTHWSKYSRYWNESNLWDTWFRMLTLARIDCTLNNDSIKDWGFINYPGIGYYHGLKK